MSTGQKKILLVDDDPDYKELFSNALSRIDKSIDCEWAMDGVHALDRLTTWQDDNLPQYVFMDITMPRMDGPECLYEIKKDKRLANLPVIMLSSTIREDHMIGAKHLGAYSFAKKPISFEGLVDIIETILTKSLSPGNYLGGNLMIF